MTIAEPITLMNRKFVRRAVHTELETKTTLMFKVKTKQEKVLMAKTRIKKNAMIIMMAIVIVMAMAMTMKVITM